MEKLKEQYNVLIVDDEEDIRDLCKEILRMPDLAVHTAGNAEEALECVGRIRFALVLTDIKMPGMDGESLMGAIRSISPETDVMIMTAYPDIRNAVGDIKSGASDYLIKPFDSGSLRTAVLKCLKKREDKDSAVWDLSMLEEEMSRSEGVSGVNKELMGVALDSVFRLTTAAEYREGSISGHLKRVGEYSAVIAGMAGVREDKITTLKFASMMHDVGKIGISDNILLKPGKLTPQEYNEMKKHTTIGSHILSGSKRELLRMASVIALTHHEKFDGTGYPQGLIGESIPLNGRIVALADVFDALISRRVYKPPFSMEKAIEIIKENSGKHFDPMVLKYFLASLDSVKKTMEEFSEGLEQVKELIKK